MYLYVHYNKKKKLAAFQPFKLVSFYRLGVWVGWEGWGWGGVKKALLFAAITGFRGVFFFASPLILLLYYVTQRRGWQLFSVLGERVGKRSKPDTINRCQSE